jgi:hypothetical protein
MRTRTLFGATMLIAGSVANAGAVMESVMRDLTAGRPERSMITSAQGGSMRVDVKPEGSTMIFKDDVFYMLDPKAKTYTAMDRATIKQMADQMAPMIKQMQDQLARMTPEQRAQMEKMMGRAMPGAPKQSAPTIRKTSRTGQGAGQACTYSEVVEDGVVSSEVCTVAPGKLSGGQEFMEAGLKMGNLMKDMLASMPNLQQMATDTTAMYQQLGGIPVLTRTFVDGKPATETLVKSMRSESVPAAAFELPAGYTKRDLLRQP